MKKLIILTLFIPVLSFGADKLYGYKDSKEVMKAFTTPLKSGSKGVKDSMSALDTLNGEGVSGNIGPTLTKELKENGKVVSAKEVESDERLNGMQKTVTYELEYLNGKKRKVQLKLIKPSGNSGFHVMGVDLDP
jgi:hypothetical protein